MYYGYESVVVNQWRDIDSIPCMNDSQSVGRCFPTGLDVITDQGFNEHNLLWDSLILLAMTAIFLFLAFIGLLAKAKRD